MPWASTRQVQGRAGIDQVNVPVLLWGCAISGRPLPSSCEAYWTSHPFLAAENEKELHFSILSDILALQKTGVCTQPGPGSLHHLCCPTWLLWRQEVFAILLFWEFFNNSGWRNGFSGTNFFFFFGGGGFSYNCLLYLWVTSDELWQTLATAWS